MPQAKRVPAIGDASSEFAAADLKDERRTRRLQTLADAAQAAPGASLPTQAGNAGALEGTYRFLNNEQVKPESIAAAHAERSAERAGEYREVLVAHDTTEFNFGLFRTALGQVGRGKSKGFMGHFSLALSGDGARFPLGVVAQEALFRDRPRNRSQSQDERRLDPQNESLRWGRGIERAERALGGRRPIHLMDREADHFLLLAEMANAGTRFIVRMSEDRTLAPGGKARSAKAVLEQPAFVSLREVQLSPRRRSPLPAYRKHFPERDARTALLEFSAKTVTLQRPDSSRQSPFPTVTLNLVWVRELNTPVGQEPVEWRLWTSLPVDTDAQIEQVVDHYRGRWVIEEYFKALKTGCAFEERQLQTRHGLLNALAVFSAVAWRMLALRTAAQVAGHQPATQFLTPLQLACLRTVLAKQKKQLSPEPTAREALLAVAASVGHLKNNGEPGWQLIGRGLDRILWMETTALALLADPGALLDLAVAARAEGKM